MTCLSPELPRAARKAAQIEGPGSKVRGFVDPRQKKPSTTSIAMHTYSEALELALMSARNARLAGTKQAVRELWKIAQEYQAEVQSSTTEAA
jgi:hypothetical protein